MENNIDKITRIPITEAFRYEDKNLTPWLTSNIDVISETIGVELTNANREQSTGSFSVDIKAETKDGRIVVIENQYGTSNHDHLGKLITYLTAFEAQIGIWIVEAAKSEHIKAISWLNEMENSCDFYLLTIEAIKIGDSNIAPLIAKIIGPSEESKQIGRLKKEDSEKNKLRLKFWTDVLNKCNENNITTFNSISPTKDAWVGASSGYKGLSYAFWVNKKSFRIELRIDRGKDSEEENLRIFNTLFSKKEEINAAFGEDLGWEDLEGYRVCSIRKDFEIGGYESEEKVWTSIIDLIVDKMDKLIHATKKHLKEIGL